MNKNLNPFIGKTLESIEIIFENCESYIVPADGIEKLSISNITYSFTVHVNGYMDGKYTEKGEMHADAYCENFQLILNKKGNMSRSSWDSQFNGLPDLKNRLKTHDVVGIDFTFTDESSIYILVPWEDGDNETINGLMKCKFDKESDFTLVFIDSDPTILSDEELHDDFKSYCEFDAMIKEIDNDDNNNKGHKYDVI